MDIKVYTMPSCGYCHQVKDYLRGRSISFTEYDVSRDQESAREMVALTGQMGVPVIVVDGQVVIGFDRNRLESLLAAGDRAEKVRFGLKIADARNMQGALVGAVANGGLGSRAGLASGDVVTEISGRPVRNAGDMEGVLTGIKAGDLVTIRFSRGGMDRKSEMMAA